MTSTWLLRLYESFVKMERMNLAKIGLFGVRF